MFRGLFLALTARSIPRHRHIKADSFLGMNILAAAVLNEILTCLHFVGCVRIGYLNWAPTSKPSVSTRWGLWSWNLLRNIKKCSTADPSSWNLLVVVLCMSVQVDSNFEFNNSVAADIKDSWESEPLTITSWAPEAVSQNWFENLYGIFNLIEFLRYHLISTCLNSEVEQTYSKHTEMGSVKLGLHFFRAFSCSTTASKLFWGQATECCSDSRRITRCRHLLASWSMLQGNAKRKHLNSCSRVHAAL